MEKSDKNICLPLPAIISKEITNYEQREQYLIKFLEARLPSFDAKDINDEIHKFYPLNKRKAETNKKKPQKSPFMTLRKSILLGLNKFQNTDLTYLQMLPLNSLWLDYMLHMLGISKFKNLIMNCTSSRWECINHRLVKADYHGAIVTVLQSKCPSLVGIEGIIIQDTKNTFRLLSKDDKIRTIPKMICEFRIHFTNDVYLSVFGKELCIRPAERSVKKFKNLHVPEL